MLWSLERGINFTSPAGYWGAAPSPEAPDFSAEINEEIQSQSASATNAAQTPSSPEGTATAGCIIAGCRNAGRNIRIARGKRGWKLVFSIER